MALDMQSEFYKIAKNIIGTPKNFHKLFAITPDTGRVSMMGADGGVFVSSGMLSSIVRAKPEKAYRYGKRAARDLFDALVEEFDEELKPMAPQKKMELAYGLARATGWGDVTETDFNSKRKEASLSVGRPLEAGFKEKGDYMLTAGYIAGMATVSFDEDMECVFNGIAKGDPTFIVRPVSH